MTKITLRSYNREIEALTDQGKIDLAIAHCLHILKFFPKHVDTYRLLGKAYLENQRLGDAADVFQRVLSAVPDDFVAHIGMSIIREDEGNLDAGIWHMQRAYDVQSSNVTIQDELRRLYEKRDGIEPPKIRLTRAALARMYARGDLISEAIAELRSALQEDPERSDLLVLLARMYALNQQRVKCIQTCSQVLNKLPYCLEANLTISDALEETNRAEEAVPYRERAIELDPYAAFVSEQTPQLGLVPDQAVTLLKLDEADFLARAAEAQPSWVTSLGEEIAGKGEEEEDLDWLLEGSAPQEDLPVQPVREETDADSMMDTAISPRPAFDFSDEQDQGEPAGPEEMDFTFEESQPGIPDWMQEAGWTPGEPETQPPAEFQDALDLESTAPEPPTESSVSPEEEDLARAEIPDWLQALAPAALTEDTAPHRALPDDDAETAAPPTEPGDAGAAMDWLEGLPPEPQVPQTDLPDWLMNLGQEDETVIEAEAAPAEQGEMDWLAEEDQPQAEPTAEAGVPDWLQGLGADLEETGPAAAEPAEDLPDWLRDLSVTAEAGAGPAAAAADIPDWLLSMDEEQTAEAGAVETGEKQETDLPDWLKDLAARAESGTSATAGDPGDTTGVTLWLAKNAAQEGDTEAQGGEPEGAAALQDEGEAAPAGPVIPAWLQDLEEEQPSESAFEQPPAPESIPAWLQGLEEETPAEAVAEEPPAAGMTAPEFSGEAIDLTMGEGDEALRWLESLAARQGAREDELLTSPEERIEQPPSWVQDLASDITAEPAQEEFAAETILSDSEGIALEPSMEDLEASVEEQAGDAMDWEEFEEEAGALPEIEPAAAAAAMAAALSWKPEPDVEEEHEAEFLAQPEEAFEKTPDWTIPAAEGDQLPAEEVPAWLQELTEEEAEPAAEADFELPDWLKDMDLDAEAPVEPAAEAPLPDWLQQTMITRRPVDEAETAEPAPAEAAAEEDMYAWVPDEAPAEAAAEVEEEAESWPAETTGLFEPAGLTETAPAPEAGPDIPVAAFMEQMGGQLENARAALERGDVPSAVGHYQDLIRNKSLLDKVIDDLQSALQYNHPVNIDIWATLGDAYARQDSLQKALDAYTKAEELLR